MINGKKAFSILTFVIADIKVGGLFRICWPLSREHIDSTLFLLQQCPNKGTKFPEFQWWGQWHSPRICYFLDRSIKTISMGQIREVKAVLIILIICIYDDEKESIKLTLRAWRGCI